MVIKSGRAGEIYNIGGGKELTNLELSLKILSALGFDETKIKNVPDRLGHDSRYSVSIKKISEELGYFPETDFAIGLEETISFYRDNQQWWMPLIR